MPPLVSILIPCYNAGAWLAATIESSLAQTWPRIEVIVVDDGSCDGSLAIARSFATNAVRVVTQPNAGASAARNHARRLAQGEFIQFLDADDLLTRDKISAQVALLGFHEADCIATCRWSRITRNTSEAVFMKDPAFRDFMPIEWLIEHTGAARRMMHPGAWLVPRAVASRAGPWNESLSLNDDGEYFARVALASRKIVFSPAGASLYRTGVPGSLSGRRDRRALESVARSVELIAAHLLRAEDSPRVRRALADYWQRLIFDLYPDAPDLCRRAESQSLALGGSSLRPEMGPCEQLAARLIGWRPARHLRRLLS